MDFSRNSIRLLHKAAFEGLQGGLRDLNLRDNLLGDTRKPVFSSPVLASLSALVVSASVKYIFFNFTCLKSIIERSSL